MKRNTLSDVLAVLAGQGSDETRRELGEPNSEASQLLEDVRHLVSNVLEGNVNLRALPDIGGWHAYVDRMDTMERIAVLEDQMNAMNDNDKVDAEAEIARLRTLEEELRIKEEREGVVDKIGC